MSVTPPCASGCSGVPCQGPRLSVGLRRLSVTTQPRHPIHRLGVVKVAAGKGARTRKTKKALEEDSDVLKATPGEPKASSSAGVATKDPETPSIPTASKALQSDADDVEAPNYALWIVSLLAVIGTFYVVVFYAGAGFFYFLSQKIDFKRKDFVPYSETLRLRKEEQAAAIAAMQEQESSEAPALSEEESPDGKDMSGVVASEAHAGAEQLPFQDFGGHSPSL